MINATDTDILKTDSEFSGKKGAVVKKVVIYRTIQTATDIRFAVIYSDILDISLIILSFICFYLYFLSAFIVPRSEIYDIE